MDDLRFLFSDFQKLSSRSVKQREQTVLFLVGRGIVSPFITEDLAVSFRLVANANVIFHALKSSIEEDDLALKVKTQKPTIIFSLDGKGLSRDIFHASRFIKIAWFVDNPSYFEESHKLPKDTWVFSWDRSYLQMLKGMGYERVYYLPLATRLDRFCVRQEGGHLKQLPVSFVGTIGRSEEDLQSERRGKYHREYNRFIDTMKVIVKSFGISQYAAQSITMYLHAIQELPSEIRVPTELCIDQEVDSFYRNRLLNVVQEFKGHWYGQSKQQNMGDFSGFKPSISYGNELSSVYQNSLISLNATRPQLRTALNQRIFDVFGSGGFLLSDYREDYKLLFPSVYKEFIYESLPELRDKIQFFLKNSEKRKMLASNMRREVVQLHTYDHRVRYILNNIFD